MPNIPPRTSHSFSAFSSARDEADQRPDILGSPGTSNADEGRAGANSAPNEVTELERRVLAHERILLALIGHLADDDPEILRQLTVRFGSGHDLGRYEQNYVSTDDYGDHFIRSVETEVTRRSQHDVANRR